MRRNEYITKFSGAVCEFSGIKVKEDGQRPAVGHACRRIAELVEKGVAAGFKGVQSLRGDKTQQLLQKIDGLRRGVGPKHLLHRDGVDVWQLEADVIVVHGVNLLLAGRADELDDRNQLLEWAIG